MSAPASDSGSGRDAAASAESPATPATGRPGGASGGIFVRDRTGMPVSPSEPDYAAIAGIIHETKRLCMELNTRWHDTDETHALFERIVGHAVDPSFRLNPPFHTDFGRNITLGRNVFINWGCTLMDRGGITIGDDSFLGPNVRLITINHLGDPRRRATTVSRPIVIGQRVWVGAGATVLQGVTIGDNAIVGAAAVVTHDVPENAIVAGNPARVIDRVDGDGPDRASCTASCGGASNVNIPDDATDAAGPDRKESK